MLHPLHTHTQSHTPIHTRMHACVHTHVCMHARTCTHNTDLYFFTQMTHNHLYWTVTTILQEQCGTRCAEIVKHMIKIYIASVSSYLLSLSILLCYYCLSLVCLCECPFFLQYLKDLRNFNTMFAILRYVPV